MITMLLKINSFWHKHFIFIITMIIIIFLFIFFEVLNPRLFFILFCLVIIFYISFVILHNIKYYYLPESNFKKKSGVVTNFILHSFLKSIQESLNLRDMIDIIITNTIEALHVESCVFYLLETSDNRYYMRGKNFVNADSRDIIFSQKSLLCTFLVNNQSVISKTYLDDKIDEKVFAFIHNYMTLFNADILAPILFDNELLGFIFLSGVDRNYLDQHMDTLRIINAEIAISFKNAMSYHELKKNYIQTIDSLVMTVDAKDLSRQGHSERVQALAVKIAKALHCKNSDIEILRCASMLHGIGHNSFENKLLARPDKIKRDGSKREKYHALAREEVTAPIDFLEEIESVINQKDNIWDSQVRSDRLASENISLLARILQIADRFDSIVHSKKYGGEISFNKVVEEMKKTGVAQLDQGVIEVLKQSLLEEKEVNNNIQAL
ncbi:MAG: HD domain-containing protein [bacterium]|nr:HD domain-containing protein [bacterium]